jgi:hypothetical protein
MFLEIKCQHRKIRADLLHPHVSVRRYSFPQCQYSQNLVVSIGIQHFPFNFLFFRPEQNNLISNSVVPAVLHGGVSDNQTLTLLISIRIYNIIKYNFAQLKAYPNTHSNVSLLNLILSIFAYSFIFLIS